MASIFTYAKTIHTVEGDETFTAGQCASFDEAKKFVDAGVRDRQLELKEKYPGNGIGGTLRPVEDAKITKQDITPPVTGGPINLPHTVPMTAGNIPPTTGPK